MLRIERSANGQVVFTLSGRMQTEDIEQIQQLLVVETSGHQLVFNLRDVTLELSSPYPKLDPSRETSEQEAANAEKK